MASTSSPIRVVATAFGVCSPLGLSPSDLAPALHAEPRDADCLRVDDAALGEALTAYVTLGEQRRLDRMTRFGVFAALACMRSSGLAVTESNRDRVGGIFGGSFGAITSTTSFIASGARGYKYASPLLFPQTVSNACSGVINILLGTRGVSSSVSGLNPVIYAVDMLRAGRADALLVGGFEELTPSIVAAVRGPLALCADSEIAPEPVALPCEGAAVVMLETREHAERRGANILFEILGCGQRLSLEDRANGIDNVGFIDPDAIRVAMTAALNDARVDAADVRTVISLARTDNRQQASERQAIDAVWNGAGSPDVRYPKPRIGEMFGASETLGTIAARLYDVADSGRPRLSLVNNHQLGGSVSSVILEFS